MESFEEIINNDKLTLVDFFATWCGPCQAQAPVLEELKQAVGDNVKIVKIDVDNNMRLAAQYQVRSIPTLVIFKKGEPVWRDTGFHDLETLKNVIATL